MGKARDFEREMRVVNLERNKAEDALRVCILVFLAFTHDKSEIRWL